MSTLEQRHPQKRVLVTGATSGLGKSMALEFAARGWRVAVTGLDKAEIHQVADAVRQAGGKPLEIVLDVAHVEQWESAAAHVNEQWQGLDVLVNNAGIADGGRMEDLSLDNWRQIMDVNVWSVVYGCRTFIPLLKRGSGGHILNVASGSGLACLPEMASYNATKAAVIAISATLKTELVGDKIGVTVSCPSAFQSNIGNTARAREVTSIVAKGIMAEIQKTHVTAAHVARYCIRSMEKGKLFSLPQADARVMWVLSRWMPEGFRNLLTYLFNKRLWLFAPAK